MKRTKNRKRTVLATLSAGLACLMLAGTVSLVGIVRADNAQATQPAAAASSSSSVTQYTVTYTQGDTQGFALFADVTGEALAVDVSGCITLPGTKFSEVITSVGATGDQVLDCETFYFETYDAARVAGGTLWAYTFTGWHIVGQESKLPAETVFQPGDVITPEVLAKYAPDGTLQLEALWAKCYFIQNPYENMVYKNYTRYFPEITVSGGVVTACNWERGTRQIIGLSTLDSTNPTGAYDVKTDESGAVVYNKGNDPANPLASIDYLYRGIFTQEISTNVYERLVGDPYDAYSIAVVLTGDLDYVLDKDSNLYNGAFEHFDKTNQIIVDSFNAKYGNVAEGETAPTIDDVVAYGTVDTGFIASDGSVYRDQNDAFSGDNPTGHTDARAFGNVTIAPAVTFKSLQNTEDGSVHSLYYKPYDDEGQFFSSMRFDNIYLESKRDSGKTFLGETVGNILRMYDSVSSYKVTDDGKDTEHYFETTGRFRTHSNTSYVPIAGLRSHQAERVVVNGGYFSYHATSWGDADSGNDRFWYVGRSASFSEMRFGITSTKDNAPVTGNCTLVITGGTAKQIWGGSNSMNGTNTGDRTYRIYGAGDRQPVIYQLYGGGVTTPMVGNVDILIRNCTKIGNVFGGGMNYSAAVRGNISIVMENTSLVKWSFKDVTYNGDLYGGGQYGCCEDNPDTADVVEGDVSILLQSCSVAGTIYGSGRGNVNSTNVDKTDVQGVNNRPADWSTAPTGFSVMNEDFALTQTVTHVLSWRSGFEGSAAGIIWNYRTTNVSLSVASVNNATIQIVDSDVHDVYGGGTMAIVNGDTNITISGSSSVSGSVYGGGNGTEQIGTVKIYAPCIQEQYQAPEPVDDGDGTWSFPSQTGQTNTETGAAYVGELRGEYTWTNDVSLITEEYYNAEGYDREFGLDHDKMLIYTPYDVSKAGQVVDSTTVTVDSGTTVTGNIYGGGNAGAVGGSAEITVDNATVSGTVYGGGNAGSVAETTSVTVQNNSSVKRVYGGGNAGPVEGKNVAEGAYTATVTVTDSSFGSTIYGGGANGELTGSTKVYISNSTGANGAYVFGGGDQGAAIVTGNTVVEVIASTLGDGTSNSAFIFGGGNAAAVSGNTAVSAKDTSVGDGIFGGGNNGPVGGSTTVTVENCQVADAVVGGGNKSGAAVTGSTSVLITGDSTTADKVYGGGSQSVVGKDTAVTITGGSFSGDIYGGGNAGAVAGNTQVTVTGGSFSTNIFGGGCDAGGTVGGDANVSISGLTDLGACVYGGGNAGTVTGTARLTITDTAFQPITTNPAGEDIYIFGGGNAASVGNVELRLTNLTIDRPSATWGTANNVMDGAVFGGGNSGSVENDVEIIIENSTIGAQIFGGGNQSAAAVKGNVTITATDLINSTGLSSTAVKPEYTFYGGGRAADVAGAITVTINDGIYDWITGGGSSGDAGSVSLTLNHVDSVGGYPGDTHSDNLATVNQPVVNWCLRGGCSSGKAGEVKVTIHDGWFYRNVHCGGNDGTTASVEVLIAGGIFRSNVFGGGDAGNVTGNTKITVTGGRFNNIFGGGDRPNSRVGGTEVIIDGAISFNAATYYIYGGSQRGLVMMPGTTAKKISQVGSTSNYVWTENAGDTVTFTGTGNTSVTVTENASGTIHFIYGGSYGAEYNREKDGFIYAGTEEEHFGTIFGSTSVVIEGGTVSNVAGGNAFDGTISGDTNVTVTGGTVGYAYGGNNAGATVNGDTNLVIQGGTVTHAFGGSNEKGTILGTARAAVSGGTVTNIYGGGNKGGSIGTGTVLNISGGTVSCAYGGSNVAGAIAGTIDVNMSGGHITSRLCGGGKEADVTDAVTALTVDITGGIVAESATVTGETAHWVYGGSYAADCAVVPQLTISGSTDPSADNYTFLQYVAGGCQGGDCPGTNVVVKGGKIDALFGGGDDSSSTVSGPAQVTVEGGEIGSVRGGGNLGSVVGENGHCYVTMTGGRVVHRIIGGGNKGSVSGNTYVHVSGGTVGTVYGGGDSTLDSNNVRIAADVLGNTNVTISGTANVTDSVYGGGNWAPGVVKGDATVNVTGGTVKNSVYGGGYQSVTGGNTTVNISGGTLGDALGDNVYGGGNHAVVEGSAAVNMTGGKVVYDLMGGGNNADVLENTAVDISGGTVGNSVYGGGNQGAVQGNVTVTVRGDGSIKNLYGGGYQGEVLGDVTVTVDGAAIPGEVFGGGYGADVGSVSLTVTGEASLSGTVGVFGGGKSGAVNGNVSVAVESGALAANLYGGGMEGHVYGDVTMDVSGGSFSGNIYGGGQRGTVENTDVTIRDAANILGNVFGGGEGPTADVKYTTSVLVDLNYDFQVTETPISTTNITSSGMTQSQLYITPLPEQGMIMGSVYGGGDMGRVGDGTITVGGDKATILTEGSTRVVIEGGLIMGSVFGGGCGEPKNVTYTMYMGTVFGSTSVEIHGGLIGVMENGVTSGGNVYGGGEQSRVYAATGKNAATVSILETVGQVTGSETVYKKIAICGSVFGGGDRGDSATANASVPTVYGDVYVLIQGIEDHAPSDIYFLGGGVYGDGNLCLVEGYREIKLQNFEPTPSGDLVKTFYSLQRADKAILENSAVVLLGAPDLVEEGDNDLYSINRIGKLEMTEGSVVKLDQIVKYLGGISSDVHPNQQFIHDGTNGRTDTYAQYTTCGCKEALGTVNHTCDCLQPLTAELIDAYRNETGLHNDEDKNVICVANGLYLEIIDEQNHYGPVTGLFTLQLLYANPGEGGGFVYGSIPQSTGDFICETNRWIFKVTNEVTAENFAEKAENGEIFIRVAGKAFQRPESYSEDQTYYTRQETDEYMDIIDDVGGATGSGYTYYYWYIGGPSVTYNVEITGYIGASATEFVSSTTLPQHDAERSYVLYGVSVNEAFAEAVGTNGTYKLVQTGNVTGQQIAVELRLGGQSLGFLVKTENGWAIQQGSRVMAGYSGAVAEVQNNVLLATSVTPQNDQLTWVFHKASTVSTTVSDLEIYLDIDLYESVGSNPEAVTTGTSMLAYTTNLNIVRLTASQSLYHDNLRSYTGVAASNAIHITGNSSFTAEYQTRYVPAAYPSGDGTMIWALSTRSYIYYMASDGSYFTVDPDGKIINPSEGLDTGKLVAVDGTYKLDTTIYSPVYTFSSNAIPRNTKITMVDLSGDVPAYYYYICTEEKTFIDLQDFMQMGTTATIASMTDKPAFMDAYTDQNLSVFAERLLFVFDFEQAEQGTEVLAGGITLQHLYGGVDIMDYVKDDATGSPVRYFPKVIEYQVNPAETGVAGESYTAAFQADSYDDIGSAVLRVHVEEDANWINTIFRENGFALKIQLVDESGNAVPMPAGMYFEYKGQYYYPGVDSTFIAVPVHEFGDHEITIHNPQFSLADAVGGNTAQFRVYYYSAPDANYYNAFDTQVVASDSYTITAPASYSLQVTGAPTEDRILSSGEKLDFTYSTRNTGTAAETVQVAAYVKAADGSYVEVAWTALFADAPQSLAEGTAVRCAWTIADGVSSGTYRLVFRYADRTEYLNLIIQ